MLEKKKIGFVMSNENLPEMKPDLPEASMGWQVHYAPVSNCVRLQSQTKKGGRRRGRGPAGRQSAGEILEK